MKRMKVITIAISVILASSLIPSAEAASKGYRYWGYYQAQSKFGDTSPKSVSWKASMTGPTSKIPDGSVEGWVFTFDNSDIPSTPPSVKPSFGKICGTTKAEEGMKRVAIVIDFGSPLIAPKGEKVARTITRCVVTGKDSLGIDILAQVVKVRTASSGFVCGLNGYPAKECGVEIATPKGLKK
ncbi:unannotated protein [freshwater metagenome]|uniref:Unannotated protein n=1 Tax=freshwater metagenome TaxID=449393 RepID=A0A6J5Z762_9ZZZZ